MSIEPVAKVLGISGYGGNKSYISETTPFIDGTVKQGDSLYTAPPTTEIPYASAIEAAYLKAEEVCLTEGKMASELEDSAEDKAYIEGFNNGRTLAAEQIRALSGTDALRELMIQVAVIVDAVPCELKLSEIKKIVDSVIKGGVRDEHGTCSIDSRNHSGLNLPCGSYWPNEQA